MSTPLLAAILIGKKRARPRRWVQATRVRAQVNDETNRNQLSWGHTNLIGSVYLNPAPFCVPRSDRRPKAVAPAPGCEQQIGQMRA